jgi:hypothetical protein
VPVDIVGQAGGQESDGSEQRCVAQEQRLAVRRAFTGPPQLPQQRGHKQHSRGKHGQSKLRGKMDGVVVQVSVV